MKTYDLYGPFKIPFVVKYAGNKEVIKPDEKFWNEHDLVNSRGCYIFAIGSPKNFIPYYIGKATKTFKQETFTPDKLRKYNSSLSDYKKGHPYMFFIVHPKGKVNKRQIMEIEKFLVRIGYFKNPDIKNEHLRDIKSWSIKHVTIGSGKKGKISRKYGQFRKMMSIYSKQPV